MSVDKTSKKTYYSGFIVPVVVSGGSADDDNIKIAAERSVLGIGKKLKIEGLKME